MIEIVEQILGAYTPAVDGGINYTWFAGAVFFAIVLYSALRIFGAVICGGRR